MFSDLVGSTALSARIDPEEMSDVIHAYQNSVAGEVARYEGNVAKLMGDGALIYFGWPIAHEDDAERAVRTGLSIIEVIKSLQTPHVQALSVRIGIATGLVVVGDLIGEGAAQEDAVVGETPNLAARLQALAQPGQVVIADMTRRLLGEIFDFQELAPQSVKGIPEPVNAFTVKGERTQVSRFEARSGPSLPPMVGRDQELSLLIERWAQARDGDGQGVLLVGEAGLGKSRLTHALCQTVAPEPHTRLRYQCSPYHTDSALWPVIQQLASAAGLASDDSNTDRLDKLEAVLKRGVDDISTDAPLLASLLGLDGECRYGNLNLTPRAQRNKTLNALEHQLFGLAANQPVLMVLEDAHWIDPSMHELVEQCLDHIADANVLMLMTSRPDNQPGFAAHPNVTRLNLNRLGRQGVEAIVSQLLGNTELPGPIISAIVARTDGIPLFIEELTKAILETGKATVPASLHDSLMARLDNIPDAKEIAQIAACIGREFDFPLLAALSQASQSDLISGLNKLGAVGLLYGRGVPPDSHYTFKHALVRDAAYEGLLKSKRRTIHARIVEVLDISSEIPPELLAHHAAQADLTGLAIDYWHRAGKAAIARSAYLEAVSHLNNAIKLVKALGPSREWDQRELELQVELGQALIACRGYSAQPTAIAFTRAKELAETLGDTPLLFPTMFGEWVVHYIRAEPTAELANSFVKATQGSDDSGAQVVALRTLALERFHGGQLADMLEIVEQILRRYDTAKHRDLALRYGHDPRMATLCYKAWSLCYLGYPEQAEASSRAAIDWATELNHGNSIAMALCWGGMIFNVMQRQSRPVAELAENALRVADELSLPLWRGWSRAFRGWAIAQNGDPAAGIAELEAGLIESQRTGAGRLRTLILGLLAESSLLDNDTDKADVAIAEAFRELMRSKDVGWEAELHRIRAQLLLQRSKPDVELAIASLHRSIDVAKAQGARLVELRSATALCRVLAARKAETSALVILRPIYDWFTEGFGTPDLVDAKAVLDAL